MQNLVMMAAETPMDNAFIMHDPFSSLHIFSYFLVLNFFYGIYFYLELSEALENERRVNEELRNALDNDYEETDKTDDRQTYIVKELQISLTAVQVLEISKAIRLIR